MVEKLEENQIVIQQSELIVVSLSYSRKFLFEISDGLKMLELLARSIELEEPLGGGMKIRKGKKDDIGIAYLTKQRFRELILEAVDERGGR